MAPWRKRRRASHIEKRLSALQQDLTKLQRDLRGLAAVGGEVAGERVVEALGSAGESARIVADRAAEQLESWTNGNLDPVRDQVRSQPLASVLLSIGAGALVGALLISPIRRD